VYLGGHIREIVIMPKKRSSYEGKQDQVRSLKLPAIEAVKNIYTDRDYTVHLDIQEFSCICPKTGLPDYAVLELDYIPDKLIIELKSLKLYITGYRTIGIFHENVINRISDDIIKTCKPRYLKLTGVFNVRGGIETTVEREYQKGK
jgi:7-cyano-7-deazaguanine reductase